MRVAGDGEKGGLGPHPESLFGGGVSQKTANASEHSPETADGVKNMKRKQNPCTCSFSLNKSACSK